MVGRLVRFGGIFGGDLFIDLFQSWLGFTYGRVETLTSREDPNVCLSVVSVNPLWPSGGIRARMNVPNMTLRDLVRRREAPRFCRCCSYS